MRISVSLDVPSLQAGLDFYARALGFAEVSRPMPVCLCEPRPGGRIRYEWQKGDKGFYLTGEFVSLTPVSRIEHIERMHLPDPTPDNHIVTEFTPQNGGTRMVMTMTLPDAATRQMMLASGMDKGMEISYQRLESTLEGVS